MTSEGQKKPVTNQETTDSDLGDYISFDKFNTWATAQSWICVRSTEYDAAEGQYLRHSDEANMVTLHIYLTPSGIKREILVKDGRVVSVSN